MLQIIKIFKYNLISYFKILKNIKIINNDFKNIEKTYFNTIAIYKIKIVFSILERFYI